MKSTLYGPKIRANTTNLTNPWTDGSVGNRSKYMRWAPRVGHRSRGKKEKQKIKKIQKTLARTQKPKDRTTWSHSIVDNVYMYGQPRESMIRKPCSRATRKVLIRAADGRQPSIHPSKEKALGGVKYISRSNYSKRRSHRSFCFIHG